MSDTDKSTVDRFLYDVERAVRKHADLTVMTGAGGHRRLFPAEVERISRVMCRILGVALADVADPPSEDVMATDELLSRYEGRAEAAADIRGLALGAWDR